ncbi:MAG: type II toxin-antitoxin system RelE/ParE family toxin [Candidatus Omnitrophota bacterium]|jgi:addiction module RelE/StbE family toxin|nr:MAG: type II toxin-antitoxin system RelE/ParE family toxin [Candidatus Omnitrophota bacterium]
MKIIWTTRAKRSLSLIADYIAENNPSAAYHTIRKIRQSTNRLKDFPFIGRSGRVEGTRELVVLSNYILPYRIKEDRIEILHVFHAQRKWPDDF